MAVNRAKLGNRKYKQGNYLLQNSIKYIGQMPVKYRSSWELAFCKFCDLNSRVVKWSAEFLEIPYQIVINGQTENHRYYPDFYVEMTTENPDVYDKFVIELKPNHELEPPTEPKRQSLKMLENFEYAQKMYRKNLYKWAFARDWCERRGLKYKIITEEHLKKSGLIP